MVLSGKLLAVAALALQNVKAYDSYLTDCETFASEFGATCGGTWTDDYAYDDNTDWASSVLGQSFTCDTPVLNQYMNCPDDTGQSESCNLTRKNCITCYRDSGQQVWLRVQSNAIPNHCYGNKEGFDQNPQSAQISFDVHWNKSVLNKAKTYDKTHFATTEDITSLICNTSTTTVANIPSDLEFTNNNGAVNMNGIVGIGIDNTILYNALDEADGIVFDALYNPRTAPTIDSPNYTDLCLHQVYNNWLIYRSMGVCMKDGTYKSVT